MQCVRLPRLPTYWDPMGKSILRECIDCLNPGKRAQQELHVTAPSAGRFANLPPRGVK